ncbi:hypothetical protein BP5796_05836 [Coleophoma crateriformis]|uniref:DUF221-domain-containing protein n=1 Tax=Coleophoma crateriformis TaxID=565419 RepID=A0A3D8RVU5_9HELO|nr:hypothetical protein BP5796_05836 [Coleophoma crateriformis]
MYMVSRECVYYINLRQAYLISPYYAKRLSSRTVLFTCVPQQVLDGARLRKLFGDSVRNVWIPRDTEDLEDLVKEREQTALRLEKAEIELIKMANAERNRLAKTGHPDIEANIGFAGKRESEETSKSRQRPKSADDSGFCSTIKSVGPSDVKELNITEQPKNVQEPISPSNDYEIKFESTVTTDLELKWGNHAFGHSGPPPDVNGSIAAQWIPHEWRPTHRPIANYGRRVDTIKWTRNRLKLLAPKIGKLQRQHKAGKGRPIAAAFIEFDSQVDAQAAYQSLAHHRALHMKAHINGVRPDEIVWTSLRMHWWERIIRHFAVNGFIAMMVVFWSIPAALIGIISNIDFISTKVFFLHWVTSLPSPVLGVIKGLLPAVGIALLMAAVPGIMRMCARQAGVPSMSMIELFVQQSYFIFQVVQVFLITTLTSAASAALTEILENPMSARTLLSQNLPKSSNFYVSYFILQGLAMSATRIVHLSTLVRLHILKAPDNPAFVSKRWHRLRPTHWGSIYPVFTNMGVIAISYSCIAPLVLGFASIAFYLVYRVYHYNLLYVYDAEIDTRGLLYPHALKQLFVGIYMAEVCLLGLFGLRAAFGPVIMMVMLVIFTFLIHVSINDALGPLLYNLPKTLAVKDLYEQVFEGQPPPAIPDSENPDKFQPINEADLPEYLRQGDDTRAVEGLDKAGKMTLEFLQQSAQERMNSTGMNVPKFISYLDFWTPWITPDPTKKPNFLLKWLHPEIFSDHTELAKLIPPDLPDPEYPGNVARDAYWPPAVIKKAPVLWIPRDEGGVSRQECEHSSACGVTMTDEGITLDEKNRLVFDFSAKSPVLLERLRY